MSHPVWVRGLKPGFAELWTPCPLSHPVWVRGLKHISSAKSRDNSRRTPCGCVD